jgi:phosphate:Na+ symporter
MTSGLKILSQTKEAENLFTLFSRRWSVGTLFGVVFTTVVQASSVTIGILQKLYAINADGITSISLNGALPVLLGANIGTTITAILSSIGGNTESKRASVLHLIFNIINTVFFLVLLAPFIKVVAWFEMKFLKPYSMLTIAFAHIFQKTVMGAILFFFIPQLVKLSEFFVKDKKAKPAKEHEFDDKIIQESPILALEFVKIALMYMGNTVYEYFKLVRDYSFDEDESAVLKGEELENIIDSYDRRLHDYLIKIARAGLSIMDSKKLSRDLDTIKDFERIGDHLNNIAGFFQDRYNSKEDLSEDGANDLLEIYEVLDRMMINTLKAFENQDVKLARTVIQDEDYVDELERSLRYRYIERLKAQEVGFAPTYPDILANLERIGDHLKNIASSVIEPLYVPQSMAKF